MIQREEYLKALEIIKAYRRQCSGDLDEIKEVFNANFLDDSLDNILDGYSEQELQDMPIEDMYLSVRAFHILKLYRTKIFTREVDYNNLKVSDLKYLSESELMKCRNCGIKTLNEIKYFCRKAGITLSP